ncbi:MAG: AMP-binding protein [Alphaproteobacteria bacterium]|nr:AMP-binding protein [Alphaproteobacteria bacterium]MBO6627816.1 AMP-binding protein [Alphaproteobacteria bacterium]MDF1628033.1 AMP-binding protein [Parvibaculaceae bacterium]
MTRLPIGSLLKYWADKDGTAAAITHEGQTVSRADFDAQTNRLARAYEALGVRQGDLVTIGLPNSIEFYAAAFAVWKLGATPQPISAKLPPVERQAIVEVAEPTLIVGAAPGSHGDIICLEADFQPDPTLSDAPLPEKVSKHWKAPTSGGSTGRPKIIISGEEGSFPPEIAPLGMETDRVQLVPGPLYHNAPFSFSARALMCGNHIIVMTRFDAEETLRLLAEYHVDWVMMVPTMMQRIWRLPKDVRNAYDLSALRMVLHLAAPCPAWLKEEWINWLGPERIHELYAGTEAQSVTWITGSEWLDHRGSVGRPMKGGQMKILGEDGHELPPGQIGEVFMRPDAGVGTTYHYRGATAKATQDGWESLGDMGYMDEDGFLYLADRQTDMILSGGANIYPAEVEAAIDAFPGVRSSAVIGLPDDDMGNLAHGIVDAPDGIELSALQAHLAENLSRYKIPRSFEFVSAPVRDDAGKVRRSQLRTERLKAKA